MKKPKQRTWFQNVQDYLICVALRVVISGLQALSLEKCMSGAHVLAFIFSDLLRIRRPLLKRNLRNAFPDLDDKAIHQLSRDIWTHLFLLVAEVAHAPRRIQETTWRNHVALINVQPIIEYLHQERPIIFVTGHFGNFELGGYLLGLLGYPSHSVARNLDNPFLDRWLKTFREATGQYLISKNDGYDDIIAVLENQGLMAFLADQSAGRKGCWIDFFNQPASTYKAMGLLSLEYQAIMVVCYATRRPNKILEFDLQGVGILDPLNLPDNIRSVPDITQWFTSILEGGIRHHPDQYWWIHNRWKTYGTTPKLRSGKESIKQSAFELANLSEKRCFERHGCPPPQ